MYKTKKIFTQRNNSSVYGKINENNFISSEVQEANYSINFQLLLFNEKCLYDKIKLGESVPAYQNLYTSYNDIHNELFFESSLSPSFTLFRKILVSVED